MIKKSSGTEPFVMLPRSLLESEAWQSLSINGYRLVTFLMIQHMRHAGTKNGFLVAPRKQLVSFGIGSHFISRAIEEAECVGLLDCIRGTGRAPNRYTLTWLPFADGTAPGNRWRHTTKHAGDGMSLKRPVKGRKTDAK